MSPQTLSYPSTKHGNPVTAGPAIYIRSFGDESQARRPVSDLGLQLTTVSHPVISSEVIKSYGGKEIQLKEGEIVFREGEAATHYYQVSEGSIKMSTVSPDGKEFILGIFKAGESLGEPPLICDFPYPSSAVAMDDCRLYKLTKDKFFLLLRHNFEIHMQLSKVLCERLRYKSMVLSEISSYEPEHRIMSILKYLRTAYIHSGKATPAFEGTNCKFIVPFTRQQLADMTGLRVETVIRTVKKMTRDGKVKLTGRKIEL